MIGIAPRIQGVSVRHQRPRQALNNDEQTEAWDPHHYHHHSSSLYRGLRIRPGRPFPFREMRRPSGPSSTDPPRTPLHLEPLSKLLTAKKPSLRHTQDGSPTPTGGNSCATTPAMPALDCGYPHWSSQRARDNPRTLTANREAARSGAVALPAVWARSSRAWTRGVQPMGTQPGGGIRWCPTPPI